MKKTKIKWLALACAGALFLSARAFALDQPPGKGDIDGDGAVTAADARAVLRGAVGLESCMPGTVEFLCADVDGSGGLTAEDARCVLRAAVGLLNLETMEEISVPDEGEPTDEPTAQAPVEPITKPPVEPIPQEPVEQITEPPVETTTQAPPAPAYPLSAKGYEIREVNGITYVGGVLIANKTYSLPASYNPGSLTNETYAAFLQMQQAAARQGLRLWVASGFRSYSSQSSIYSRYVRRDGRAAADRYSARPGHSEHQTGLAFDLNTITQSFANTNEGRWVAANCYKYGFILRYPKNKEAITGYMYEPWHLRYLGVDLATRVYASGLCLEEYLGIDSRYR